MIDASTAVVPPHLPECLCLAVKTPVNSECIDRHCMALHGYDTAWCQVQHDLVCAMHIVTGTADVDCSSNVNALLLQMLDRYVQESKDNAHPASHSGSDSDSDDSNSDAQSSTGSEGCGNSHAGQQEAAQQAQQQSGDALDDQSAHLARLQMDDHTATEDGASVSASDDRQAFDMQQQDVGSAETDGRCVAEAGTDGRCLAEPGTDNQDLDQGQDQSHESAEHLPDHVAIRTKRGTATASHSKTNSKVDHDFDDSSSVMSHGTQVPSQEAVQQRVVDQQRSRMRRQVLARASRNAQKVGNKRERKQTASSVNW